MANIKFILSKISHFLMAPIVQNLHIWIVIYLMTTIFDVYYFCGRGEYVSIVTVMAGKLLFSYLWVLPLGLKTKWIKKIYLIGVLSIVTIFSLIDGFCVIKLGARFNENFVAMIKGSNPAEVLEFFENYGISQFLVLLVVAIVALVAVCFLFREIREKLPKWIKGTIALAVVLSAILVSCTFSSWLNYMIIGKCLMFTAKTENYDYKEYYTDLNLASTHNDAPQNVVLIIGESLSRQHCQLFGYEQNNQPCLSKLKDDSLLYTFDKVRSVDVVTTLNFKGFMSTYNPTRHNKDEWYKHTTFIEVMQKCGYNTHWISNHSKKGFHDNIIGRYADLCDTLHYNDWYSSSYNYIKYDESLLATISDFKNKTTKERNFYVCHLMGSHYAFSSRYPEQYSQYTPQDYAHIPENQREKIAEYDNTVLYNDYVVSSIISMFADEDAVVVYFSDHGLDLYYSSDNYCGHSTTAKGNEYAVQIPFLIYTSERYKQHCPEIVEKMRKNEHAEYCTADLIYLLMDIVGVDFADAPRVDKYTLLRP